MNNHEREQERLFTRRALFISAVKLGLLGVLGGRMFQLQVLERDKYLTLAEENRINLSLVVPERGLIYDRFNVPLAVNVQDFRLLLVAERAQDLDETLRRINALITLSPSRIERIRRDIQRQKRYLPVLVEDNLTWEQVARIEVSLPNLPGVLIEEGKVRFFPQRDTTAHLLGYVGVPNEKDVKADPDPLLQLPGFQIGKSGLERQYDKRLRGVSGRAEEEVNATGRKVRVLNKIKGIPGDDVHLTLDAELQFFVHNRLSQERSASAVIMDAVTGAVYAIASYPAFDPNVFSRGIPQALWDELLADPAVPLNNKAITGQYPPGSTFKMMTALAGLEAGALSPHRRIFCPGHMKLGSHTFHCWKRGGHGAVNLHEAMAQSCDVYFYQTALDIGIDKIAAMSRRFGLGARTGIDMPGEMPGIIPDQQWKRNRYKQSWHLGESLVNAIGQGYTLTTPLQLAVMTARLVNGGLPVVPYLAQRAGEDDLQPPLPADRIGVNAEHLALVKASMDAVVNAPTGTARGARPKEEGMSMGGKTGTAQVRRITMEERRRGFKIEDAPWEQQHHALFVGYAPVDNPRYVCAVIVEHGGGGSAVAAPLARDILVETQRRMPERSRQR